MSHPLDDAVSRCHWARKRFNLLQSEIMAFPRDAQAVKFRQEFDSGTNVITVFVANEVEYPIEWALAVSEILYNCRVALDYVAWELRNWQQEREGKMDVEDRSTMFVIASSSDDFSKQKWRLKFIHPDHVEMIEALQPYAPLSIAEGREALMRRERSNPAVEINWEIFEPMIPLTHPLTILAELNSGDKHKILKRIVKQARESKVGHYEGVDCEIQSTNIFVMFEIQKDAKWVEIKIRPTGVDPKVIVRDEVVTGVSFGGRPVDILEPIINCVARVVQTFKPIWSSHETARQP